MTRWGRGNRVKPGLNHPVTLLTGLWRKRAGRLKVCLPQPHTCLDHGKSLARGLRFIGLGTLSFLPVCHVGCLSTVGPGGLSIAE